MRILIIKVGAAGDVLRTSPLLHVFKDAEIDWFIDKTNAALLDKNYLNRIFIDPEQIANGEQYDLVISLEDDIDILIPIFNRIKAKEIFGAYINDSKPMYTDSAQEWFNMGIISRYGLKKADMIKLENRKSYQEMIFDGLGFTFDAEEYIIPAVEGKPTILKGDIAIAPKAGSRWPSKNWHYYPELINLLQERFVVNVLPSRDTLEEHISDINNHQFLISGDSLPMHIALGLKKTCVTFFTCTSPWEIYDYNRLTKIISPTLDKYFYSKGYFEEATQSISLDTAFSIINKVCS